MTKDKSKDNRPKQDIPSILGRIHRPKKAVVTAGMPYANGPIHIGHLAGAQVPADIYARWMRLIIGSENVLFVCGTDDHGSNSEVAAKKQGISVNEFIDGVHSKQLSTIESFDISLDTYTGTSRKENIEEHKAYCQEFLRTLYHNKFLNKKASMQWFDTKLEMFLPDRFVQGICPNQKCENTSAYSDECDACGSTYDPSELKDPRSTVSDATPVLKETDHWWLDMWKVSNELTAWLKTKQRSWRKSIMNEVMETVLPSLIFSNANEPKFKELRESLPKHKSRYAPGKQIVVQFESLEDLAIGKSLLIDNQIESTLQDGWAHRSITRDVSNGIPVPADLDASMSGKTLYVWPESLIAPISFTKLALKNKGLEPNAYKDYWCDPESNVYQFLGVDNVFFYVLMQGAMWFGSQKDSHRMPVKGELQLTDIFSSYHLQVEGKKMSKSVGNFYTADELLKDYDSDQIRYFLAILSLSEKASNFDFEVLKERNKFLAGPLNAAFEKPISACSSKFDGIIPSGKLIGKTEKETLKIIQTYTNFMQKAEYPKALFAVENYARIINGLFNQYRPHDDRHDLEERKDALYSSFYILRNIVIMLSPFAPKTMEKLRESLNLPESIYNIDELGNFFPDNHKIGKQTEYFPSAE